MDNNMNTFDTQTLMDSLQDLSDESRLWIFQSNRKLNDGEVNFTQNMLQEFLSKWTSHNHSLIADGFVALGHFIIIALDESRSTQASGCSIDTMTNQIQGLAQQVNADLMDRTTFYFMIDEEIQGIQMNELSEMYKENKVLDESLVFNNLIQTKGELKTKWLIPLKKSWHFRFV